MTFCEEEMKTSITARWSYDAGLSQRIKSDISEFSRVISRHFGILVLLDTETVDMLLGIMKLLIVRSKAVTLFSVRQEKTSGQRS